MKLFPSNRYEILRFCFGKIQFEPKSFNFNDHVTFLFLNSMYLKGNKKLEISKPTLRSSSA